ncbi:MAG: tRNA (guanine(46)-N(7))-methyltransferase TrmB, partial [Phycisphaerales bacterium]
PDSILTDRESGRIDPRRWFPDPALPLELEIGVGKGTFLVNHAPQNRGTNFLGIEWAHEFYLYAADRLRRRAEADRLANVRLLHANAVDFLKWRAPDAAFRVIHLYYSDPWPKRKHHKNRVIQDDFLAEARRTLAPGGELRIVTDHDDLWAWNLEHFARWTAPPTTTSLGVDPARLLGLSGPPFALEPFTPPDWVGEGQLVATNYERKFRRDDRPPHACTLRRLA